MDNPRNWGGGNIGGRNGDALVPKKKVSLLIGGGTPWGRAFGVGVRKREAVANEKKEGARGNFRSP